MRILFLFLPAFFIVACNNTNVQASKYYIASAEELSALSLHPGDTVILRNGDWVNQNLVFRGQGTEPNPIVFCAETPGKVIMKGNSTLALDGLWIVADGFLFTEGYPISGDAMGFKESSSYCRLTNMGIVDYNHPDKTVNTQYVSLRGFHNRVDHCYFKGKTNSGPTLVVWLSDQPNYHQIDHNFFGHRPPLGVNGGETMRIGNSTWSLHDSYTTVELNYFEHCDGELEIISNKSCHNTYRYNTFFECKGTLTLRHGNFAQVYGNFFFGNGISGTGGIRVIGEDHKVFNNYLQDLTGKGSSSAISIVNGLPNSPLKGYYQVKRANIICNTIVNCTESIEIGTSSDSIRILRPLDCSIANNVIISKQPMITEKAAPINMKWEGNIMFGDVLGISPVSGIEIKTPKLSLSTDSLWRPASDSPVRGAFKGDYHFVIDDMDGQKRGLKKDAGADQISKDAIAIRPLNRKSDVGPEWSDVSL